MNLNYSWNGATEVVSYTVSGGTTPGELETFAAQPKTGFEESTPLEGASNRNCFFRVTPFDKTGQPTRASNIVYLGDSLCPDALSTSPTQAASRAFLIAGATGPTTVTLSIAEGTVIDPTVFVLTSPRAVSTSAPEGKIWSAFAFHLETYSTNGYARTAGTVVNPTQSLYLTIDYRNLPLPHVPTLSLAVWNPTEQVWSTEGVELLSNDTVRRELKVSVAGPGLFALLADNQAPTSSNMLSLTEEDTPYLFQRSDFPYDDRDGDPIQAIVITSMPEVGIMTLGGTPISNSQIVPASATSQLVFVPLPDGNGIPYTTFGFSVSDGYAVSTVHTGTILVRPLDESLYLPGVENQK